MNIHVTEHAVERFRERFYSAGSARYIVAMIRNALKEVHLNEGDNIFTFGIVTFVTEKRKRRLTVVTCYQSTDNPSVNQK